jgi:cellulose biosynthesis protein BcsQ
VICTFYSYKGGVGRSMALARAADILARAGLRVLMIDFDLEAPGLEQYFSVDQKSIRSHAGLFDLILAYKAAMAASVPAAAQNQNFRKLDELFITPVYLQLPSGGKLDLMPAGRRGSDEELSQYALGLRQFDWQDFYFNFGGEVFFEWLRRSLDRKLYDVVLVDSRTGVTEMGGICAYQLADLIVVMCAPNQQNLDGTRDAVRNFLSSRVMTLRAGRPLQLLVVPSRVETRDEALLNDFRSRFDKLFTPPEQLTRAGLGYWDFMIPYDPRSAFQEHVVGQDSRASARSTIGPAVQKLVNAIGLLAEPGEPVHRLSSVSSGAAPAAEPQYDVTSRAAGYDVFLAYQRRDVEAVRPLVRGLERRSLRVFFDETEVMPAINFATFVRRALQQSGACAVIVGPSGDYPWRSEFLRQLLDDKDRTTPLRFLPVLLPGARLPPDDVVPPFLAGLQWLRLQNLDDEHDLEQLVRAITSGAEQVRVKSQRASTGPPYKGFAPFEEADAPIFFGREELVGRIVRSLDDTRFLAVIGPSGVGKTSVVHAGVIPALRRGAVPGSDRWHYVVMRPGAAPVRALCEAFAAVTPEAANILAGDTGAAGLDRYFSATDNQYLLVVDQFEEVLAPSELTLSEQKQFFELLEDIVANWKTRVALIIVLRSDQINRLLELAPTWANLVENNIAFVPPMNAADMRKAIEAPAQSVGLAIEPGLTDLILRDAAGASGALPLLQYVLRGLWERSRHGYLTVDAYEALGGVTGSLAKDAEDCFTRLGPEDRDKAMSILLRLVRVTPDGAFVRRVAKIDELMFAGSTDDVHRILAALVDARLVVVSSEPGSEAKVDLAHEAIIRSWPRFHDQIERLSQFLRLRTRLEIAAARWHERGQDPGFLYPEGEILLLKDQGQLQRYWNELSESERSFIAASEYALRRRQRRARAVTASLASLVALMSIFAIAAVYQFQKAMAQRDIAVQAQAQAQIQRQLAGLANLGAASVISPDGKRMLQIDPQGYLRIIDLATGKDIRRIAAGSSDITAAAFSPDTRLVVTGTSGGLVSIYDNATLAQIRSFAGHENAVRRLAFSPDGRWLASGSDDATARIWSVDGGTAISVIQADSPVVGVAFSPDGTRLVVSSQKGSLYIVDTKTGQVIH